MHYTAFTSDDPIQHLSRALSELQRIGFLMREVTVTSGGASAIVDTDQNSPANIRILYKIAGTSQPETYAKRLAGLHGVHHVESGAA